MNRKRRGRGEGAIYQRDDGMWCGSISIGYDEHGKRRRRVVYGKTKREVQDKLRTAQALPLEALSGASRVRLAEYLDHWLNTVMRGQIRRTTFASYETTIRVHIKPRLGGVPLDRLGKTHVSAFYAEMDRDGVGLRTKQTARMVLNSALNYGARNGFVHHNPLSAVDGPRRRKKDKKKLSTWTQEEVAAFLKSIAGDRLEALYVLALTTGLRQGELLGLHWRNVDLKARTLSIEQQLTEVAGKLDLQPPKSEAGRRKIELPGVAVRALANHRKVLLQEGLVASEWVFCDSEGGPIRKSNLRRRSFEPLIAKAGVPRIRFHDLRHTAATILLGLGVHPKIVQERLGHSEIRMTLDTYSHVLPTMQKEAADRLEVLFGGLR